MRKKVADLGVKLSCRTSGTRLKNAASRILDTEETVTHGTINTRTILLPKKDWTELWPITCGAPLTQPTD